VAGVVRSTTIDELAWLHDSEVRAISITIAPSGERVVTLSLTCGDLGYPRWNEKAIDVIAFDVITMRYELIGRQTAPETLDTVNCGVTSATASLQAKHPTTSPIAMTFVFHSGSAMEITCETLEVSEPI